MDTPAREQLVAQGGRELTAEEIERADFRSRHSAICQVCTHPDRGEIEAAFLSWNDPRKIARAYRITLPSLRRHTAAFDLDVIRARQSGLALSRLLEDGLRGVDAKTMTVDDVLRVANDAAKLTRRADQGVAAGGNTPEPAGGTTVTRTWEQTVRASETKAGEP